MAVTMECVCVYTMQSHEISSCFCMWGMQKQVNDEWVGMANAHTTVLQLHVANIYD